MKSFSKGSWHLEVGSISIIRSKPQKNATQLGPLETANLALWKNYINMFGTFHNLLSRAYLHGVHPVVYYNKQE
jgi:hypothetical protein